MKIPLLIITLILLCTAIQFKQMEPEKRVVVLAGSLFR